MNGTVPADAPLAPSLGLSVFLAYVLLATLIA